MVQSAGYLVSDYPVISLSGTSLFVGFHAVEFVKAFTLVYQYDPGLISIGVMLD